MDNLYKSAMKGVEIVRKGEFVELRVKGISLCLSNTELFRRQQWASAKPSTGNPAGDRQRLFTAFETVIAQAGSGVNTRGNEKALLDLAKQMKQSGLPMEQWGLDKTVLDKLYPVRPVEAVRPADSPG